MLDHWQSTCCFIPDQLLHMARLVAAHPETGSCPLLAPAGHSTTQSDYAKHCLFTDFLTLQCRWETSLKWVIRTAPNRHILIMMLQAAELSRLNFMTYYFFVEFGLLLGICRFRCVLCKPPAVHTTSLWRCTSLHRTWLVCLGRAGQPICSSLIA